MRFYLATSIIFPRSLRLRLFALCFVATHMPLLGYIGWGLATGRVALAEFILLTSATVIGTALALLGIGALLSPIHALAQTLKEDSASPALQDVGDVIRTLYTGVHNAALRSQAQIDALEIAAHEDALTGIANRRGFLAHLEDLPADKRRGCVAIIDIDHFKKVNDLMGHDEGDRVLRDFAGRLSAEMRRIDLVCRWGGEEFAVFFQDCIEDEASWSLARLAERIHDRPLGDIDGKPITFSAGICHWGKGSIDAALGRADEALYEAKRAGRNQLRRAHAKSSAA